MENLNKQQIVLLTLLVSFVTSIATGITTVSLLEQAPAGVSQTINQVVERTIEKVVPVDRPVPSKPNEVTVVVKEEDLVVKAVDRIKKSSVRIHSSSRTKDFLGIGVVVKPDIIATESTIFGKPKQFEAVYNGATYPLEFIKKDDKLGIVFYRLPLATPIIPVAFANIDKLAPGQSIVSVSGSLRDSVSIGIISSVFEEEIKKENASSTKTVIGINTTIGIGNIFKGSPFSNLEGELVGIKAGKDTEGNEAIVTSNKISELMKVLAID